MAYNLLLALHSSADINLSVVLLNEGRLADELRAAGIRVSVFEENRYSLFELIGRTRAYLKGNLPDVVHAHRYKENLLACLASIGFRKMALVATQHGLPEALPCRKRWTSLKMQLNFFLMSHFFGRTVAVSHDIKAHLVQQHRFSPRRVAVIHNGVSHPSVWTYTPCTRSVCGIGSSGRLFPVKDYPLLVEIARIVSGRARVRFELAGEGPCRGDVESLVEQYGLGGSFVLRGHLTDMAPFYHGIDIYINTSLHEGIPMTILEAMACGLPVVAPAVGGIQEIVEDGVTGFLIKGRDPKDFAERCLELVENEQLRTSMSRAARDKAFNDFSTQRMARQYMQLYHEVIAGGA